MTKALKDHSPIGKRNWRAALAATMLLSSATVYGQAIPHGDDFHVNSYTSGNQVASQVAHLADRSFVIVWRSEGSPADDNLETSIQAQLYDTSGQVVGAQFQVNQSTGGYQSGPRIARTAGGFVVVWQSDDSAGSDVDSSIQAQLYDLEAAPVGAEFQVNTYTTGSQISPDVATTSDGGFLVTWASEGTEIAAQRFDSAGAPQGAEMELVSSFAASGPVLAVDDDDSFVVVWTSSSGAFLANYVRYFESDGTPKGEIFTLSDPGGGLHGYDVEYYGDDSEIVIAWYVFTTGAPASGFSRFDQAGTRVGGHHTDVADNSSFLAIIADGSGGFMIVGNSNVEPPDDTSGEGIWSRRYGADAAPLTDFFQVNTHTDDYQLGPTASFDLRGDFVITWTSLSSPDDIDRSVRTRRFRTATPIFEDGFESSNTSAWSDSQP